MTVQEVFDLLNNVGVDFDGWYGDQCVDWAQIINRLYKASILTGTNASDIWNTYPQDFYDRIENKLDNHPQKGDIVIWEGVPGHIAVATDDADINRFASYDQNFPTGSRVHLQEHDYDNPKVLGWLRPKNPPIASNQIDLDQARLDRDTNWNLALALFNALNIHLDPNNKEGSKIEGVNAILKLFQKHDEDTQYIAQIKQTDSQILEQDGHLAEQLLDAQKLTKAVLDERQSFFNQLGVSTTADGLRVISSLQAPHAEVVANVQPVLDGLAEAAMRKTKSPQVKSTLQKIIDFLRGR